MNRALAASGKVTSHEVFFRYIRLAAHAVEPFVAVFVERVGLSKFLPQCLRAFCVRFIGGADELVVGDI